MHVKIHHFRLPVLKWLSMLARILNIKLSFLHHLLTCHESLEMITRNHATIHVYDMGLTQQCLFLDPKIALGAVAELLSGSNPQYTSSLKRVKTNKIGWKSTVKMAATCYQLPIAKDVRRLWSILDIQNLYKRITTSLFDNHLCPKYDEDSYLIRCLERVNLAYPNCSHIIG